MAERELADVRDAVREAVRYGRPGVALFDAWPSLNDADPGWQVFVDDVMAAAARMHPSIGAAARVSPHAAGVGLVDRRCRLRGADARFLEWVGEPAASADCRRLAARALAGEGAIGLVTSPAGRLTPVFARSAAAPSSWAWLSARLDANSSGEGDVLLVAFAPSKSSTLAARAAAAMGFTPLEARVAEALLDAPNLAVAADLIGVGRETAKDAVARAVKKAGVRRASELVARLVQLTFEAGCDSAGSLSLLGNALGLSPAEARVAAAIASGSDVRAIGARLSLSEETVKSYRRSIYGKAGIANVRDLSRLISEVVGLDRLAAVAEVAPDEPEVGERLRVLMVAGRQVAFTDYGPSSGAPLLVGHGSSTGRLLPAHLIDHFQAAGMRPIVPQRPGFGLSEPAKGAYLQNAADDLGAILDSLGCASARAVYREGGVSTLMAFAERFPDRLSRALLINPRAPRWARPPPPAPMSAIARLLLDRPALVEPFAEMLRRQTRSEILSSMIRRACSACEADRRIIADDRVLQHLVRDAQGLMARSVRGFVDEQRVYAAGWSLPDLSPRVTWKIAWSGALVPDPDMRPWRVLKGLKSVVFEQAGSLIAYSHPEELTELLI